MVNGHRERKNQFPPRMSSCLGCLIPSGQRESHTQPKRNGFCRLYIHVTIRLKEEIVNLWGRRGKLKGEEGRWSNVMYGSAHI